MARAKQIHSLSKLQSRITKKKGATKSRALHENSRDAKSLARAIGRQEKISERTSVRARATEPFLERVYVVQELLKDSTSDTVTAQDLHDTISAYIKRNDDEIAEEQAARRPGRPKSTREEVLSHRKEVEEKEFVSGFWVPDARDAETVELLKKWEGTWASLAVFKFVRVNKDGAIKESKFPPKGES